jgi:hypothetical protein
MPHVARSVIGPEHQHFAVGHVDHAHETERDRQPECGEEEYTAEADAVKHVTDGADDGDLRFCGTQRSLGRGAYRGILFVRDTPFEIPFEPDVAGRPDHVDRVVPHRGVGARKVASRERQLERSPHGRVSLVVHRRLDQRRRFVAEPLFEVGCGSEANGSIR